MLVVLCSAAEYEGSGFDEQSQAWNTWIIDGTSVDWLELVDGYYYKEWQSICESSSPTYNFTHEPLATTFRAVNDEPEKNNFFDTRHEDEWNEVESVVPIKSLTASFVEKYVITAAEQTAKKKAAAGRPVDRDRAVLTKTDASFKGVFGRMNTRLKQGGEVDEDMWESWLQNADAFVDIVSEDNDFLKSSTCMAPFCKLVLKPEWMAEAPEHWADRLDRIVKKRCKGKHDTAESWVNANKPKPAAKSQPLRLSGSTKKATGRGTRPRSPAERLVDDDEEQDEEDEDEYEEIVPQHIMATDLVQKAAFKGLVSQVKKLEAKVAQLETENAGFKQNIGELQKRSEQARPEEKANEGVGSQEMEALKTHNKEMITLMAQLGTVVQVLAPPQAAAGGTNGTPAAGTTSDIYARMVADALFDGITNTITNVFEWNTEKKTKFYSALKGIPKFNAQLPGNAEGQGGQGNEL